MRDESVMAGSSGRRGAVAPPEGGEVAPNGGFEIGMGHLPSVTAYGYSGGWFVSWGALRSFFESSGNASQDIYWNLHIEEGACDNANMFFDDVARELYEREQDHIVTSQETSDFVQMMTAEGTTVYCEKPGDLPGASLCVDAFIRGAMAGPLTGNDRRTDPNAKKHQSKMQFYLDLDAGRARIYWTGTTMLYPALSGFNGITITPQMEAHYSPPSPSQIKYAQLIAVGPGHTRLEVDAWNALCEEANAPACYAIKIRMEFRKGTDGRWALDTDDGTTDYPSFDVFRDDGAGWQLTYQRAEKHWTNLDFQINALEQLRRRLEQPLPMNCNRE